MWLSPPPRKSAASSRARRGDRIKGPRVAAIAHGSFWQILLQKALMASANGDSLALTRFAVEADDDGTAES
jgi:hypothetical protein